ncbi:MAG: hypothetical protein FJ026_11560 [Chloroflexi bacterium]|nr:hypothetical protein [Chloroflexota bacterium]
MPRQQVLILAMTYMRSGICTAGFTNESAATTHLRWVRPVKEYGNLLLGDMTDAAGRVARCSDVMELELKKPRPEPPHTEDVITDLIYHRPRLLRRLEGEHRARFLATHLDRAPAEVIVQQTRSLCLVRPHDLWARFSCDPLSGKYEARLGFRLSQVEHKLASSPRGIPVTDIQWRALGRTWLGASNHELSLDNAQLRERLHATDIYLALGLSRGYQDEYWLLVVGVHAVPDYAVQIDYNNP